MACNWCGSADEDEDVVPTVIAGQQALWCRNCGVSWNKEELLDGGFHELLLSEEPLV